MKVATIVGARPQFIKAAPVSRELRQHAKEVLIHTGQHYDTNMSQVFFDQLDLPVPDYNLMVGSGLQGAQSGEMLKRIEEVLIEERPEWVIVYGDTNSTLAGALAAAKLRISVVHIEAGLRSYNRLMPEEINRVVTDHISTLLLCPTETAVKNLECEGITAGVHLVGDVMYDSMLNIISLAEKQSTILKKHGLQAKGYFLATVHRAANTDDVDRLCSIVNAFEHVAKIAPIIWPVHPRTRQHLGSLKLNASGNGLHIIDPVSYMDMLVLEKNARVVMTDSGGAQKEAFWLQVPCVTLRAETEWVETLVGGWNSLADADTDAIVEAVRNYLSCPPCSNTHFLSEPAAPKIVRLLRVTK